MVGCDLDAARARGDARPRAAFTAFAPVDLADPDAATVRGSRTRSSVARRHRRPVQQRVGDARRAVRGRDAGRLALRPAQRARPDLHRDAAPRGSTSPTARGLIINTASVSAWRGAAFTEQAAHGAAKGGVLAITRHLAASGARRGIRANSISPGLTVTPQIQAFLDDPSHPMHGMEAAHPLGRLGHAGGRRARRAVPGLRRRGVPQRHRHRGRRRAVGDRVRLLPARRGRLRGGARRARVQRAAAGALPGGGAAGRRPKTMWSPACGSRASEGWKVSVRSGGHSWAAWSVRDDALLIDLGVDEGHDLRRGDRRSPRRTRRCAAAWTSRRSWTAHGRMFPGGHCESVGIGGFLLQGGQGWNSRQWGWGCENVVGRRRGDRRRRAGPRRRDRERRPLLGGARRPGPGFPGVITRFHLKTYDKPAAFTQDTWTFSVGGPGGAVVVVARRAPGAGPDRRAGRRRARGCRTSRCSRASSVPTARAAAAHDRDVRLRRAGGGAARGAGAAGRRWPRARSGTCAG